jgi:hypothetical protein
MKELEKLNRWRIREFGEHAISDIHNDVMKKAKMMEKEQKKQLVIATYVDLKMKNNKLPYGLEYLNKLADLEEEAENYYNKHFKPE